MYPKTILFPIFLLIITIVFCVSSNTIQAQEPDCDNGSTKLDLRSNNVEASIYPSASLFLRPNTASLGYEVPKLSGIHPISVASLWFAGIDSEEELRVAAQTYGVEENDFWPGPINETQSPGITTEICSNYDRIFNVDGFEISQFLADFASSGGILPEGSIHPSILKWPARNNPYFDDFNLPSNKDLAPFWDEDGDGNYNPTKGDHPVLNSSTRGVYATQMAWWIINDIGNQHEETGGKPMGLEVSCLAYSFSSSTESVDNATFYQFKIRNTEESYKDFYFGFFVDPDLGDFSDDFVGCIPDLNTGFCYNGFFTDNTYGSRPPIVGVRFMDGLKDNNGMDLGMTSFIYSARQLGSSLEPGTGLPSNEQGYYRFLQGIWTDGTPITVGGTGYGGTQATKFAFDGNPKTTSQWSGCSANNIPSDVKFVMGSGPTDFAIGETQEVNIAIYWVRPPQGETFCPDIAYLEGAIEEAESLANIVGIDDNKSTTLEVNLHPNPMHEQARLRIVDAPPFAKIVFLYTLGGQLVRQYRMNSTENELLIKRNNLPSGIYFYKVIGEKEGSLKVGKMVVN